MKTFLSRFVVCFALLVGLVATAAHAYPRTASNIRNGAGALFKDATWDLQLASLDADSTGVTLTTPTTATVFADATHFPGKVWRGDLTTTASAGTISLTRSGLYLLTGQCAATVSAAATITFDLSTTPDDSTYTVQAFNKAVAGTAQTQIPFYLSAVVEVTAPASTFHAVLRGTASAGNIVCLNSMHLTARRLDEASPAVYP